MSTKNKLAPLRGSQHKLCLALRRDKAGELFNWTGVRGLRLKLEKWPWNKIEFFTYREGEVVFVVDTLTGVTVAIGSSQPQARANLILLLEQIGSERMRKEADELFARINPGPKPPMKPKV